MMLRAYYDRVGAEAFRAALVADPTILTGFAAHDGLDSSGYREYPPLPGVDLTLGDVEGARASYPRVNNRWVMMEASLASAGL